MSFKTNPWAGPGVVILQSFALETRHHLRRQRIFKIAGPFVLGLGLGLALLPWAVAVIINWK